MQPVASFRDFGVISLAILLCSLGLMLKTGGIDIKYSLSMHGAAKRASYAIFAAALVMGGVLFYLFATKWLKPTFGLGLLFNVLLAVAIVCELLAAIVPDSVGVKRRVHRISAWTMAYCMLPLTLLLLLSPLATGAKILVGVLLAYMLFGLWLFWFVKAARRYFLIFQSTYVLSFYLATLVAAYIR